MRTNCLGMAVRHVPPRIGRGLLLYIPQEFRPRKYVGASRYAKTCWLLFSWTEHHTSFTVGQMSVVTTSGIDEFENNNTYAATCEMCEVIYQEGCIRTLACLKVGTVFMQRPLNFFWYTHRSRRPLGLQPQSHSLSEFTPLSSPFLLTGGAVVVSACVTIRYLCRKGYQ